MVHIASRIPKQSEGATARSTGGESAPDVRALLRVGATSLGAKGATSLGTQGATSTGKQGATSLGTQSDAATALPEQGVALPVDAQVQRRRMVADLCRLVGQQLGAVRRETPVEPSARDSNGENRPGDPRPGRGVAISPRAREVLALLLDGASEKQIARQLKLSQHTVHHHVKAIYRAHDVASRGELLSKCLKA